MTKGIGILLAGTEGVGKTSFASEFPKRIDCFSIHETGFEDLIELGDISPKFSTDHQITNYSELVQGVSRSSASTIVVDSLVGYERILTEHVCRKEYEGDIQKFLDFYKGPRKSCPPYATEFWEILEHKRRSEKHVILISHVKAETFKNPRGLDYTTLDLDLDEGIRSVFKKFMANILFMDLDPGIDRVTKTVKGKATEAKMKEGDSRVIFTQKSLTHTAKNKLKLPVVIDMGSSSQEAYENFVSFLPPIFKDQLQ